MDRRSEYSTLSYRFSKSYFSCSNGSILRLLYCAALNNFVRTMLELFNFKC